MYDGVVLNCISMFCLFCLWWMLVGYNENGNTSSVKVMNRDDMLLWAMDHPPPTKMHVILTLQGGAFKDVVH
jgi:hypothetical protein